MAQVAVCTQLGSPTPGTGAERFFHGRSAAWSVVPKARRGEAGDGAAGSAETTPLRSLRGRCEVTEAANGARPPPTGPVRGAAGPRRAVRGSHSDGCGPRASDRDLDGESKGDTAGHAPAQSGDGDGVLCPRCARPSTQPSPVAAVARAGDSEAVGFTASPVIAFTRRLYPILLSTSAWATRHLPPPPPIHSSAGWCDPPFLPTSIPRTLPSSRVKDERLPRRDESAVPHQQVPHRLQRRAAPRRRGHHDHHAGRLGDEPQGRLQLDEGVDAVTQWRSSTPLLCTPSALPPTLSLLRSHPRCPLTCPFTPLCRCAASWCRAPCAATFDFNLGLLQWQICGHLNGATACETQTGRSETAATGGEGGDLLPSERSR